MKPLNKITFVACILQCLFLLKVDAATIDWKGTTNSDWGTGTNWSSGSVPGSGDAVQIGVVSFTNQPTLNSGTTTTIASLTFGVTKNITLTVNSGYTLAVTGNITQNPSNSLLPNSGTLITTLAGAGSITCASFNVGNSTTFLALGNTNNLDVVSTISSLHISGNVAINSANYAVLFAGFSLNNAYFSLQGGTTIIDGTILTANTTGGILPTIYATPGFSVDMPSGSALSPVLQLTNAAAINTSSQAGTIDFYNNTGGTGTSTVYYNGTGNQEVYTNTTAALNTSPSLYQNLIFAGSLTKKADAGNVTVANNLTLSAPGIETVDFATNSPVVTIGGNFVSNSGATLIQGGTGTMTVTGTSSNGGTLNQTGSGNITFTGALTNVATTGIISQTSTGAITSSAGFTNAGTYTQGSGSTGGISITGALSNSGIIKQTAGNITVTGNVTNTDTLSLGTANLTISGNYSNTGVYLQSTGTTLFNGSSAETLQDASTAGTNFNNVSFSGAGAKTMSSGAFSVSSTGILTMIGTNSALASNGNLTLKSDTMGSATVAAVPKGATISGNVNVQRFMSGGVLARRGYRLMSSPVNQGSNIYSLNYLINSCYLTGTNGPSGGLDKAGNPTLYLFRENMAPQYTTFLNSCFRGINNISTAPLYGMDDSTYPTANIPIGNGYLFFFRGDRSAASLATETTPSYVPVHATLTATGTLNIDTITVREWYTPSKWTLGYSTTMGNDSVRGYNLVGNPYASSINWDTFQTASNTTGIYGSSMKNKMYVLDEVTKTFGSYIAGSGGVGSQSFVSNIIASGQGFFVVANCSCARLTFSESAKTNTLPLGTKLLMGTPLITTNNQYLRLQLMGQDSTIGEQTLIRFKDNAPMTYDDDLDAYYKPGLGAASLLTLSQDNAGLCINTIPLPGTKSEMIRLNVNATAGGLYSLSLRDLVAVPQLYDIWLMDAYKKDSLDMRQNKTYSFNIDKSDTTSFGSGRFILVIRQNPAHTYQLLAFSAIKVTGAKREVQVAWSAVNEGNYTAFTVERSIDSGSTYQVLDGIKAAGQGSYSLLDNNPIIGANLYRLKQQDINNAISYSKVVTIQYSDLSGDELGNNINIYPNPVNNNISLNIADTSSVSETYDIKVINTLGLIIQEKTTSGASWQGNTANLQPGTYILRVFNHDTQNLIGESKFVKL
ncbi:MAG TPA: T9SS type A sorting domain-containing protein [Mucilaginibacter sp.]